MGTCKNCKNFKAASRKLDRGSCDMTGDYNEVMSYEGDEFVPVEFKKDRAYAWDAEGFLAGVTVGINFGCIHFNKKEG